MEESGSIGGAAAALRNALSRAPGFAVVDSGPADYLLEGTIARHRERAVLGYALLLRLPASGTEVSRPTGEIGTRDKGDDSMDRLLVELTDRMTVHAAHARAYGVPFTLFADDVDSSKARLIERALPPVADVIKSLKIRFLANGQCEYSAFVKGGLTPQAVANGLDGKKFEGHTLVITAVGDDHLRFTIATEAATP